MQTYDQMIKILEGEKFKVLQEDYHEGYNGGLDYAIRKLKGLEKQEKTFLEVKLYKRKYRSING